ncbi:hypothetical protein AGMMS49546_15130 [Spirochaetia bacterium]|nr:hypothetical protein AGMMS49546_15130 [Spirochaetia bacterium]
MATGPFPPNRVTLGRITELRTAILDKNGDASKITMNPYSANEVVASFNADEVYGWPGDSASMAGTVFNSYSKDQVIYDSITIRNTNTNTGWYVDVPSGKKIEVTKLRLIDANNASGYHAPTADYLSGFGLNVKTDFPNFTGLVNKGIYLYSSSDKNIGASSRVMAFLDKLGEEANKTNLENILTADSILEVTGTLGIPYSGNTVTGGTELNGNAAVYLLTKGVSMNELRLSNPTWYGSGNPATATGTTVRNLVLTGSNFSINDASLIGSVLNQPGLEAWISNATAVGTKNLWWGDLRHIYTSVPANPSKSAWATAVKNGTALPTFQ